MRQCQRTGQGCRGLNGSLRILENEKGSLPENPSFPGLTGARLPFIPVFGVVKLLLFIVMFPTMLAAQSATRWTSFLEERGMYFTSDRVTVAGLGVGVGAQAVWNKLLVTQADIGVLWGNGNAVPVRLALGIQHDGRWSPAVMGTFGVIYGHRTEILSETGQPAGMKW